MDAIKDPSPPLAEINEQLKQELNNLQQRINLALKERDELNDKLKDSTITHQEQIKTLVDRIEILKPQLDNYQHLGDIEQLTAAIEENRVYSSRIKELNDRLQQYKQALDQELLEQQQQQLNVINKKNSSSQDNSDILLTERDEQSKQLQYEKEDVNEKQKLVEQLQQVVIELGRLANQVESKDKEINLIHQDRGHQLESFKEKQKELYDKIEILHYTVQQGENKLDQLLDQHQLAESKEERLKKQCNDLKEIVKGNELEINRLRQTQKDLENTLTEQRQLSQNDIQRINNEHRSEMDYVQQQKHDLENNLLEAKNQLNVQLKEAAELRRLLNHQLIEVTHRNEQLESQVTNLKEVEDDLKKRINDNVKEFNNYQFHLRKDQEKTQGMYDQLMEQCEQQEIEIQGLQKIIENGRDREKLLRENYDVAIKRLEQDAQYKERIKYLETTVEKIQQDLNYAIDMKGRHEIKAEQLEMSLIDTRKRIEVVEQERTEAYNLLELEKKSASLQANETNKQIQELENQNKNWIIELRDTERQCAHQQNEVQRLKETIRILMEYGKEALRTGKQRTV
ncbi:hypothetical protein INT45_011762 [Circinella minor]|uniref:Uncharacterized protein n=1 Tax=Circinella minor TaxID=1195481 RepID=A0A8H7VMJ8_9FUNG|nr:hypothetical protein INT45_011762 [Circinella minor]